ncbi:MAG TPA: hypothetical protein VKP69_04810, partial [Isosphaeraceae bacterium]|nr:hypothetical protein [Isosphaeraceae bacterium]
LRESDLPLEECRLTLNFLGCPNSCGAHWGADLGFSGKALRGNNTLYPGYMIVAGAKSGAVGARLARSVGEVSARDLPDAVVQILRRYLARGGAYDSFADYLDQGGEHEMRRVCQGYEQIPRIDEDRAYYTDWDSDEVFSLAGRGQGEWIVDPKYWTARAA